MNQYEKLKAIEAELNGQFLERADEIHALLLCLVAKQHCLLIGPPGTAKSLLVRSLADRLGAKVFQWLLTKFSTPEEIFGPVSMPDLKAGRYKRITTDKMPEADCVFIDEIFKANSAILNSMLTILNERVYHNNGGPAKVPLQFAVGASNEFPQGEELNALFDRFLVRMVVNYLADDASVAGLLNLDRQPGAKPTTLDAKELEFLQAMRVGIDVPQAVRDAMVALRRALKAEGIIASDRRWRESLALVQAEALMAGRVECKVADLEVLRHVLWSDPGHKDKAQGVVLALVNPWRKAAVEILDEARSVWGATDPETVTADAATEIGLKLKGVLARAEAAAKDSGSSEFNQTVAYIKARRKDLKKAILGEEG